jgi:hypothetical protein
MRAKDLGFGCLRSDLRKVTLKSQTSQERQANTVALWEDTVGFQTHDGREALAAN